MKHRRLGVVVVITACLGTTALPRIARPPHKKALADYLGPGMARKLNDCRTCHVPADEGADALDARPHNPFGKRLKAVRSELKKAGKPSGIAARVEAVADEDSDGDGISNLLELVTGHFPGEADDRPAAGELAEGRAAIAPSAAGTERISLEPVRASRSSRGSRRPIAATGCETRSINSSPPSTKHAA